MTDGDQCLWVGRVGTGQDYVSPSAQKHNHQRDILLHAHDEGRLDSRHTKKAWKLQSLSSILPGGLPNPRGPDQSHRGVRDWSHRCGARFHLDDPEAYMCRKDLLHLRYDVFRLSEHRVPVDPEDHTQPTLLSFFALLGVKQLISTATSPFWNQECCDDQAEDEGEYELRQHPCYSPSRKSFLQSSTTAILLYRVYRKNFFFFFC